MSVRLFDISHWNATADFATAKAAGYAGVYLKATDWSAGGSYTDATFTARAKAARAAGLHVGAYLFFQPGMATPAEQVAHFASTVGGLCDLRPALDHETAAGLAPATAAARAADAAHELQQAYGVAPLVYTYRSFIIEGYCAGLGAFPLWLADYSGTPQVPGVWHTWTMWQSGQAHVPGIAGGDGPATDVNVAPDLVPLLLHPPKPAPVGDSPLLKLGSKGPKVTDVQHALDPLDPRNLTAHTDGLGVFGKRTHDVLQKFQHNRGLAETATTTPQTWATLRAVAHHTAR
jgi:GH25 family lysozyme M1 (1,4-beta-N-acetylmuramidase)